MKIHTDALDSLEIRKAAQLAGVTFTRFSLQGSRSRAQGFDVILSGHSTRRQNGGEDMAATWDQWGHFLGTLFDLDPQMTAGHYRDGEHFTWATGGRYQDFDIADEHLNHKWESTGMSVTGSYHVASCKCGAIQRWLTHGIKWSEFVAQHA